MSKFECICGHVIINQTDELPYKAAMISDLNTFSFYQEIDSAIQSHLLPDNKKAVIDTLISTFIKYSKHIYECQSCGRLWIQNQRNHLVPFKAENERYQAVLNVK